MLSPLTHPSLDGIPHGFFGRRGGVSRGLYDSLNCGLGSKDEPTAVLENRDRVAAHLGAAGAPVLTCHQIHSAEAVVVEAPWAPGGQPKADALVTRTPGLVLGALAADCMPILFADPQAGVVGAAHAGWKGALAGVEQGTLAAMERIGAKRRHIHAVIGPCISQSAYEVGPEFVASFLAEDPSAARFFTTPTEGKRPHFDLPGFMLDRLGKAGIASVHWVGACTYAAPDLFYSYRLTTHRKQPDYGRQIAAIACPVR
jgi:polyphenol oxidase